MFARVSRFQEPPERLDDNVRDFQAQFLPQVERMPGFLGLQSLADRSTGQTMAITYWESEEAMRDSEAAADRVRAAAADVAKGEVRGVERYEVLLRVGL